MHKLINTIQRLSLLVCIGFLASCSTSKRVVGYESLIPVDDKSAIISTNVAQVKSKISEESYAMLDTFMKMGLGANENLNWVEKIFNTPESLGLNTAKNMYFVAYPIENFDPTFAIFISLKDAKKFDRFIEGDVKLPKEKKSEVAGYTYYAVDTDLHLFYNNEVVILASSENYVQKVTEAKLVLSNSLYYDNLKENNDLAVGFNYEGVAMLLKQLNSRSLNDLLKNPLATNSSAALNFNDGEIVLNQFNYAGAGSSKLNFDKAVSFSQPISGIFSKKVTKDPYSYVLLGLKGEGLMDYVETLMTSQGASFNSDEEKKFLKIGDDFLKNVNGDVLFALSDFSVSFNGVSIDGSLFIEGDASKMYDVVFQNMPKKMITSFTDTQMTIVADKVELYVGVYDGFFYITTNKSIAENPGANKDNNLTSSRYYVKNTSSAQGAIDIKSILKNPMVQMVLAQQKSSKDVASKELIDFFKGMDYIGSRSVVSPSIINTNSKLVIDAKSPNSLTILVDMIVRIALASK